jgi:hypothetical protein
LGKLAVHDKERTGEMVCESFYDERTQLPICGVILPSWRGSILERTRTRIRSAKPVSGIWKIYFEVIMGTLPFVAESLEELRERYPKALERLFDSESINLGVSDRPGENRANVFDFPVGLRLIISREDSDQGQIIHLSGSFIKDTEGFDCLKKEEEHHGGQAMMQLYQSICVRFFKEISDISGVLFFTGFHGPQMIPHWWDAL